VVIDTLRVGGEPVGANDHPTFIGFDVIVTQGGRVQRVYGFLDASPSAS